MKSSYIFGLKIGLKGNRYVYLESKDEASLELQVVIMYHFNFDFPLFLYLPLFPEWLPTLPFKRPIKLNPLETLHIVCI